MSGYCDACKPSAPSRTVERDRGSAAKRGYGRAWQKASAAYLLKHQLCVDPDGRHVGIPTASKCTDHKIAHKGNMRLFWDPKNWQALCTGCNSFKAAKEEGGFGRVAAAGGHP